MGQPTQPKTQRNKKVYELYLNGQSQVNIARQFHITRGRVNQIIKREELKVAQPVWETENNKAILIKL